MTGCLLDDIECLTCTQKVTEPDYCSARNNRNRKK